MGLNFRTNNNERSEAGWSYSGFNSFRARLAEEIGIVLRRMEGFTYYHPVSWDGIKDDILPFLNHSDCDGELTYEECQQVAPRLLELIEDWDDDDIDKTRATILARDMLAVQPEGELIFC
jgi:hypothetical protein